MTIFNIFTLLGGLAFFLFGMHTMSNGLEKIAGGKLEKILRKMTDKPLKALLLGIAITATHNAARSDHRRYNGLKYRHHSDGVDT